MPTKRHHRYPPTTTFAGSIELLSAAYVFETPSGKPIPPNYDMMEANAKKFGYIVGKRKMNDGDLLKSLTWSFGPPSMVTVDKDGAVFYPR